MKIYRTLFFMGLLVISSQLSAGVPEDKKLKLVEKLIKKNFPEFSVEKVQLGFDASNLMYPVTMLMGDEKAFEIYNWLDKKDTTLEKIKGELVKDGQKFSFTCSVVINRYLNTAAQEELEAHFQGDYFVGSSSTCRIKNLNSGLKGDLQARFPIVENEASNAVEAQANLKSINDGSRKSGKVITKDRVPATTPANTNVSR